MSKELQIMDDRLWDADSVAEFLSTSRRNFLERIAPKPKFPKPFRLPTTGRRGSPRWAPQEIKEWVQGLR